MTAGTYGKVRLLRNRKYGIMHSITFFISTLGTDRRERAPRDMKSGKGEQAPFTPEHNYSHAHIHHPHEGASNVALRAIFDAFRHAVNAIVRSEGGCQSI